jgi:hypothetical protein
MRFRMKNMLAALGLAASLAAPAFAQTFQPTSMNHGRRDPVPVYPSAPAESCPAPTPGMPSAIPGAMPSAPGTPSATPGAPAPAAPGVEAPAPGTMSPDANAAAAGAFGAAPSAGTGGGDTFNPSMFGDLLSPSRLVFVTAASGRNGTSTVRSVPVTAAGSFKISDKGSPKPQDRVYVTYDYYNDVGASTNGTGSGEVHRETLGFEKTFLDGNASVGIRLPFTESTGGASGIGDGTIGDLTLYGIYAFLNDRQTGNVFSVGMALTIPTGPSFDDPSGHDLNQFIYQPFIGYIYNFNNSFFVEGFHSALISDHQNALSQDVAFGWWMYRCNDTNSTIRGIVPMVELHLYTPLDNTNTTVPTTPGSFALISDNILTVTAGVSFQIGERMSFGIAAGVPVTGPRPDSFEAITSFVYHY